MNYLIIPAYQPDLNLVKLVRLVHAKSDLHIIVVDDGSDADKKAIFDKIGRSCNSPDPRAQPRKRTISQDCLCLHPRKRYLWKHCYS